MKPITQRAHLELKLRPIPLFFATFSLAFCPSIPAQETAIYRDLKPDQFLKSWLVLKSIAIPHEPGRPPDEPAQKKSFAQDWLTEVGGETNIEPKPGMKVKIGDRNLEWQSVDSQTDIVDLTKGASPADFAIAYASAEIDMPEASKGVLGIGSDDAVKVWLNGKLIDENWAARACQTDDDCVPVEFQRGKNRLLLKVQNIQQDWSFICRLMSRKSQAQKLVTASWGGADVDVLKTLLDQGLDVNARGVAGLTPLQAARLHGETEAVEYLKKRGADDKAEMPPISERVDALFRVLIKTNRAGATVLAAQNGRVLFQGAYGLADIESHRTINVETKFRIGSITKQFTASAILKLQEEGKLSVQDKLSKYIPDFPRGNEVTLHHLLTHTSGIHSYTDKPGFIEGVTKPIKEEDLIKSFKNDPYDFDPGKRWLYDNSGFFLLGYIVEKVSGDTYENYLRKTFFMPLAMNNTGVHRSDIALQNEALGYAFGQGEFTKAPNWDMSWAGGAGALYSTVGDLYRWNEAVFGGKVLKESSLKAAFTPVKTEENKDQQSQDGYGYGWGITHFRGTEEISHGGGLNGFTSYLLRIPKENFTVAVLVNAAPAAPGTDPGTLAHLVTELCVGDQLPPRPAQPASTNISAKALEAVVGRYDYGSAIMTVTTGKNHLYAQLTGQPRFEIYPKSETEFFWKVVEAQVTFVKDETGVVTKAIHHQNGATITAPRIKDQLETKVDSTDLDAVVGKYDYGQAKAILTVTRESDHIFAQLTGQPKFEIFPKSSTEFFWKVVNAQVTFVKDNSGKVVKAVHSQGGRTFDAPRVE